MQSLCTLRRVLSGGDQQSSTSLRQGPASIILPASQDARTTHSPAKTRYLTRLKRTCPTQDHYPNTLLSFRPPLFLEVATCEIVVNKLLKGQPPDPAGPGIPCFRKELTFSQY